MNGLRIKLIGSDPEIDFAKDAIKNKAFYKTAIDVEEACEQQEGDASDIFVIGPSQFFQTHLNQIQKLAPQPTVLLAVKEKIPNFAKIVIPNILYVESTQEEILWALQNAHEYRKKGQRLDALRDHHKRSASTEANPAINLVTNLMRKCTIAEEYQDLLLAISTMKSVIDFQEIALVTLDSENAPLQAWRMTFDKKERIHDIQENAASYADLISEDGAVQTFHSSEKNSEALNHLIKNPWTRCLALQFSSSLPLHRANIASRAIIFLFRTELLPFQDRDEWLLDLSYGPLSLALEKVGMLKAIGQASKEWRSTFDAIVEPLTVVDRNYIVVKANKAFAKLVNTDIKKIKGKRCFSLLANRRSPCIGCPISFETQSIGGTRLQLTGKEKKDLLVWSYGIRTGLDSYFFQFYRNVSKETELTSTLIQSEKMAALGRLIGAVAHEINNPLAGILATSQILLQEEIPSDAKEDIEEIRSAAWRSKKIIDDLLGFTSSEPREAQIIPAVDIAKSALIFSKAALKEITVQIKEKEKGIVVSVSVSALQQILFNLITNAAHAMSNKGKLEILISEESDFVKISVKDHGPGIPPEKLSHIFDPFYTSKQEGSGTGLGLSIVKNLTQKIHSQISVESSVGKGTTFHIKIPKGINHG